MNKIYKIVWNDARNCYVVASEFASGKDSSGVFRSSYVNQMARRAANAAVVIMAALLTWGFVPGLNDNNVANAAAPEVSETKNHQYVALSPGGNWDAVKSWPYVFVTDDNTVVHSSTGGDYKDGTTGGTMAADGTITNGNEVRVGNQNYKFTSYKDGVYTLTSTSDSNKTLDVYRYGYYTLDVPNGKGGTEKVAYRIRNDEQGSTQASYNVSVVNQGGYYTSTDKTADNRDAPTSKNVFVVSYQGQGDAPKDVLTKVDHVESDTGVRTNLQEQLQTVSASTYTSAATGGSTVGGTWDYYIYDDKTNSYKNMHQTGSSGIPNRFSLVTDTSKFSWSDAYNAYVYTNNGTETIVPQDNMYVIDGKLGIFTNSDGSLYTGTVYGGGNEILLTTSVDGKIYSFWGAQSVDTAQTMATYPVAKYNADVATLTNNDKILAHNDIHHLKATADTTNDSVTFNAYRNGTNMNGDETDANRVPGSTIAVTAAGGTGGIANNGANDRKLNVTEDGNAVTSLSLGSRVGATNDISGNTPAATTQNLQSLTINGTTYGLQTKYVGDDNQTLTKNLGDTLTIKGGAPSTNLATGSNIGVTKTDGNELRLSLNKDIDLSADGSVKTGNTSVNTNGLTINDGPSVLKSGINAGNQQITNVASGTTGTTWTPSNLPATGVAYDANLNNGANIGDIYSTISSQVDVTGGSNITVTPTTSGLKTYQVNLDTHVILGSNENQVDLNGEKGTIRLGTDTSDKKVTFDGVNGQGSVAGVDLGSLTATPKVYTSTTPAPLPSSTSGDQGASRRTYPKTTVNSTPTDGTAQTGDYVTGLDNTSWDWRNLSIVNGRAATEDEVLKAGQHFFSINPRQNVTDLSTIPNYYNDGAMGTASIAIGHGVSTNPTATGSIAIGSNGTSTGRVTKDANGNITSTSGGQLALAVGNDATAEGDQSMAVGYQANAAGDYSIAIGNRNKANGIRSISLGVDTQAGYTSKVPAVNVLSDNYEAGTMQGGADIAIGNRSRVNGTGSTAIGFGAKVGKLDSNPAIGSQQSFSGDTDLAVAIGGRSLASTDGSVALGNLSASNRESGYVGYGYANKDDSDKTQLIGADGKETTDATTTKGDMGTLRATYNDDNTAITKEGSTNNLKAGTAWQANMGAVSIGSDKRTGTVTDQNGNVTQVYDLPKVTRQLTGLAAGSEDTDAVNVAQLKATENKGMNFSGQNYQEGSATELQTIHKAQGETLNVRGATDNYVNPTGTTDSNIYVTAGTGDNASLEIALNDDVKVHTVTAGTAGNVPTTTNGSKAKAGKVTIVGRDGDQLVNYDITTGRSTHNELDGNTIGRISYTDNGGTAHEVATLEDGLKFKGDDASTTDTTNHVVRKLMDQDMSITGGANTNNLSDGNIGVVSTANNDGLVVKLAKDINGITSIGNTTVNGGTTTGPKITFNTGDNAGTTISGGDVSVDNHKITNVAPGEISDTSTDAVNGSQLEKVKQTAEKGWEAQVSGTKLKDVKPTEDANSRILNFAAGNDAAYTDNVTVTGDATNSTITVANKADVNYQTVSVGGTKGADGKYSGGIYLGPTIRNSTIVDNRENAPATKTDPNASTNGAFITGLTNTQWTTGNYVSGRAATEDQLNTVAGQIRGEVSASDIYLSNVDVTYDDKGAGTANTRMSQTTATATTISGLKNSYVNDVKVTTGDDGKQLITITRNDDTVNTDGKHTAQWVIPVTDLTKGLASTDWRLVGAEQTKTTGSGEGATTTTTYDGSYTVKDGTVTLNMQDATNPSADMQHVTLTGLNTVFAANNNASHLVTQADNTQKAEDSTVSLGSTIGIKGRTLQGSETYSDTVNTPAVTDATGTFSTQNVSTKLDKDGNIVINLADNPQVKSLVLGDNNNNTTIVKKDGDHITYSYNTTDGDNVTNVTKTIANTDDGLNFTGDTGAGVTKKLNETLPVTGYKDTNDASHQNITVSADQTNGLQLQLNPEVHVNTLRAGNTAATNSDDKEGKIQIAGKKNNTDYEYTTITTGDGTAALDNSSTIARIKYKADSGVEHEVATLQDGYNLAGDTTATGKQALNGTLKISGGATTNLADANNIGVTASNDGWNLKLNQDLTGLNTVTAGRAIIGNQGSGTTHSLNYSNVTVAQDGTRTTTLDETTSAPAGSYVTNLSNTTWKNNGSNPNGNGQIVSGRAATEDQLKAAIDSINTTIDNNIGNGTFGLSGDTGSVSKKLNNMIAVQGAVSKDNSGNDATLKTGEGADITEGEKKDKKKVKNITTAVKDETLELSLADRLALNTALAQTGSSISLYGANQSYNLGSVAGTLNTHNAIQIDPDEGISLTHTDENGNVKKDGVRITGPTDYYQSNGDGTYTAKHEYDTNGSVGITNAAGNFTARMADMGGTGYLGLGNTMSTVDKSQKLDLNQLSTVTAATQEAIDAASTGAESANKKRDQWGQVAIMTDSKGNALYVTPDGSTTTDPNKAAKRSGHWYQNGVLQSDTAPNVPILAGSSTLRTDSYGNPVYKVDGRNQPMYETDGNGNVVTGEDGNPKPLQNTVAGALVSARYGTASLNDTANARGKLESPYWQSNDQTTMTRLQYLDEGHFDPTTGSFDIGVVHEVATLDDGVKVKAAYDVGSQANTDGSRNALLNKTINLTGTFGAGVRQQIEEKASTTSTPINLAKSSNIAVATYDDPNGQEGTNVLFALQKDLKGFNTIQVGGTDDASNAANGSSTGEGTIRIGNIEDTTKADQAITLANASNLRSVGSNGELQNVLYEAKDASGNVYYTSDTSDSNVEKLYRKAGGGYTKNESESDGTGAYVGDDGKYRYVSFNGDYSDQKLANDPNGTIAATKVYQVTKDGKTYYTTQQVDGATEAQTKFNRAQGRYMAGLSNTNWDGKSDHVMNSRAATEAQLQKAQQQVSTYSDYDTVNQIGGGFALSADKAATEGGSTTVKQNLGAPVAVKGDTNITTTANDADKSIQVSLNKNLDLGDTGSVKMGNTTVNNGGVTITNSTSPSDTSKTVSLTENGLNNGGNQIKNVAAGTELTDAVNVSQLKEVQQVASRHTGVTVEGGKAAGTDGNYNGDNLKLKVSKGTNNEDVYDLKLADNLSIGEKGADGKDGVDGSIGVNGKDGSAVVINGKDGSIGLNGTNGANGLTIKGDKGATGVDGTDGKAGTDGMTRIVYTDSNNTKHEVATLDDGMKYGGDFGDEAAVKLDHKVNIKGGATDEKNLSDGNIGVVSSKADENGNATLEVKLNKDLTGLNSTTYNTTDEKGNTTTTVVNGGGMKIYDGEDTTKAPAVTINNQGLTINNGPTITQTNVDMGGQQIHNVQAGTDDNDAVNFSQLKSYAAGAANTVTVNGQDTNNNLKLNATQNDGSGSMNYDVSLSNNVTLGKSGDAGSLKVTDGTNAVQIGGLNNTVTTVSELKQKTNEQGNPTGSLEAVTGTKTITNGVNYGGTMGVHLASGNTGEEWTKATADKWNATDGNPWIEYNDSFNNAANIGDIYAIAKQVNNATSAAPAASGKNTYVHQLSNEKGGAYQVDLNDNLYLGGNYTKDKEGNPQYTNSNIAIEGKVDDGNGVSHSGITLNAPQNSLGTGPIVIQQVTQTVGSGDNAQQVTQGVVSMGGNQVHNVGSGYTGQMYRGRDARETQVLNNAASIGDLEAKGTQITNNLGGAINKLDNRLDKVGAGAAALAALHPQDFDPDDKWDFAAGYGNYRSANAVAVGAFYRPTEDILFSVGGSTGGGENMVNVGMTFKLGNHNHVTNSRVAMAKEILAMQTKMDAMAKELQTLKAGGATAAAVQTKEINFPDVPENHWAYQYVQTLAQRGLLEGYPDGEFKGNRPMTRYEYAAVVYRALQNGAPVDGNMARSMDEFGDEIADVQRAYRFRVDRVAGKDNDRNKIERVRVNDKDDPANGDYRDVYGSKIQKAVADAQSANADAATDNAKA